jgi:hypothetical protein
VESLRRSHGIRQDLFGIIDVLALDPQRGVVGVQSTGNDFAGHMRKLTEERAQECLDWLRTPGTALELWAWRKIKAARGGKLAPLAATRPGPHPGRLRTPGPQEPGVRDDFDEGRLSEQARSGRRPDQDFDWQRLYERLSEDASDQVERPRRNVTRLLQTLIPLRSATCPPSRSGSTSSPWPGS